MRAQVLTSIAALVSIALGLSGSTASAAERWRDVAVVVAPVTDAVSLTPYATTIRGVAVACFNFTDLDARTLDRLVVRLDFLGPEQRVLFTKTIDRRGTFAPHVPVIGYMGSGSGTRVVNSGQCVFLYQRAMPFPSEDLRSITLIPLLLHYSDGTTIEPISSPAPAPR